MQLTSQQFADIVAGLRAESSRGRGHELRAATRIEVSCKVVIWPLGEGGKPGEARTVLARDVSLSGLGLITATPLASGAQFIVGLPRPRHQPILIRTSARHCRELADGIYAIGALFEVALERSAPAPKPAASTPPASDSAPIGLAAA